MAIANSNNSYMQIDSRRRVQSLLHDCRGVAHRTAFHRDERNRRQEAKRELESQHPDFANAIAGKITGNYIIALSAVAVVFIDMLLFGALADFLVRLGFGGNHAMILAAKIVLPILIVWLELKMSTLISMEQENYIEGMGRSKQYWFYLAFGILLVCVMPAISLATTLALRAGTQAGARLAFDAMSIGLALLALIAHGMVLFGGQSANRAMAHLVFDTKRRRLNNVIRRSALRYQREADQLIIITTNYINSFTDHNTLHQDARIDPGPFDRITREIVNEVFGYEVIQAPAGPGGTRLTEAHATVVNPPQNPPAQESAEHGDRTVQEDAEDTGQPSFSFRDEDEVTV